ncbi:hypothetical protein [Burkholderia anthina]|uniref:hypothetical protein n=1 Tax=Burkholderia anthina TaxID=179879 RepID=UPI001AA08368|nr:hypothetical protein [Burkholderia anthina]QTD88323.1 hypothetical protein J4G50_10825 [Burkholderia anthina]
MTDTFYGLRIIENATCDNVPKMTVSQRFAELMPADFVADLNAWMLGFFGTHDVMYRLGEGTVVMGPKTLALLKSEFSRGVA